MHMCGVVAFFEEMVVVGIELHLELLVCFDKCVDILHRVLHVHIIVSGTMDDEDVSREV